MRQLPCRMLPGMWVRITNVRPETSAPPEEIQAAYRRLAKAYHPDLNAGSTVAAARMARVNAAKSVLLDPATRAAYDQIRRLRGPRAAAARRVVRPVYANPAPTRPVQTVGYA